MNPNNEIITDLPGKQVVIQLDTTLGGARQIPGKAQWEGGLVGLWITADDTIQLTLLRDTAPGPAFAVTAGQVIVARIREVNQGTVTNIIGLM